MPRVRFRDAAATLHTMARVRGRDAGGVLRTFQRIRMRDAGGVLRTVWQYLIVTLSPDTIVSGNTETGGTVNISTASVLATPVGGTGPFTYAWVRADVSAYTWVISAPAAATTHFTANAVEEGVNTFAEFQVTVTDSVGATATAIIEAGVRNKTVFDRGGGGGRFL